MRTALIAQQLPDAARQPCPRPVTLPDRDLTQAEVTSRWGTDRASLRGCETRRAAAVRALEGARP